MIPLARIENAVVTTLKAALTPQATGYTIRTIATYGGQFDDDDVAKVVAMLPALLINFSGWDAPRYVGEAAEFDLHFIALAAAQALSSEQDGRAKLGGAYQISTDTSIVLADNKLGLDALGGVSVVFPVGIGALRPLRNGIVQKHRLAVYALELTLTVQVARGRGTLGEFKKLHADWDIPSFDGPAATLPTSPARDAADLIQPS